MILQAIAQSLELRKNVQSENPIEGLRAFAIVLVFFVHYSAQFQAGNESIVLSLAEHLKAVGHLGVDIFFLISGYLIYGSLMKPTEFQLGRFLRQRVKRIYPVFLVMLAIYLVLSFASPQHSKLPTEASEALWYILSNLLLLPGVFDINPIIVVSWSLSYELLFYLVAPFLVIYSGFKYLSADQRAAVLMLVIIGLSVLCFVIDEHIRSVMFLCGAGVFEAKKRGVSVASSTGAACLLLVFMVFFAKSVFNYSDYMAYALAIALLPLFFLSVISPSSATGQAFSINGLRFVGNMSYSYYLMHGLSLKVLFLGLHTLGFEGVLTEFWLFALLPLVFVYTLVPSYLLFILVEKPLSLAKPAPKREDAGLSAAV